MSTCRGDHVAERHGVPAAAGMAGGDRARGNGQRRGRHGAGPGQGAGVPGADRAARAGRPGAAQHHRARTCGSGTGGYALVAALPDRLPPDRSGPGHLVKARYTPLQAVVQGADEQGSPYHAVLRDAEDIGGMPVVVADLHSALAPVLAGLYQAMERAADTSPGRGAAGQAGRRPGIPQRAAGGPAGPAGGTAGTPRRAARGLCHDRWRGAARPGSPVPAPRCGRRAGWLARSPWGRPSAATSRSCAHRAVAARPSARRGPWPWWRRDRAISAPGRGGAFSGVAAGEAVNAAAALAGRPVAALRVSDADPRERHRGVSHHSLTAYGRVALARADVVVPDLPGEFGARSWPRRRRRSGPGTRWSWWAWTAWRRRWAGPRRRCRRSAAGWRRRRVFPGRRRGRAARGGAAGRPGLSPVKPGWSGTLSSSSGGPGHGSACA